MADVFGSHYGLGTRSYNRSAEKRAMDKERARVTKEFEASHRQEIVVGPMCGCRSFRFPHDLKAHDRLRGERDWKTWQEVNRYPL